MTEGLFAIHTGNGKGKTTAALGLVFRALGHGQKVSVIQFIKGSWRTGEQKFAEVLSNSQPGLLDFQVCGKGFTWKSDNIEEDTALAREAWQRAAEIIAAGEHQLVILDELTYLVKYKMVVEDEILDAILSRPEHVHVVVTGRHAPNSFIDAADLVTEMENTRHPYSSGIKAQKGFDF
ncbi:MULTISPECIES: cob(I)yrinic acid a,c-diamide adenosyltransferase [Desulfosediminicola]|uniref:cob(I)yrinic acid a,c-diamide adenosyltransferase n=1 Tax=Desulfosediminicola TaxID=2886823 RepID=UPI002269D805|nr:cob(I)yrinic acid a,c-diamide adenosyltransferase [Desulfosediminicola ganghwensis]